MKNIFLTLVLILIVGLSYGQDKSVTLAPNANYIDFSFDAADTISDTDQLFYIDVRVNKNNPLTQGVYVALDSVAGDPQIAVILQGKVFSGDTYANIGSAITWKGTSADTSFVLTNATATRYNYIRVKFDATATEQLSLIDYVQLSLWNE